jgi:hypothetical protein
MSSLGVAGSTTAQLSLILDNGQISVSGSVNAVATANTLNTPAVAYTQNNVATGTPTANGRVMWGASANTYNAAVLSSRNGHWPSWVVYRFYVEDLTVSGRSLATVYALDQAALAAAFATGGRYNGDAVVTNPSSLP